jgi:hypothetical protein
MFALVTHQPGTAYVLPITDFEFQGLDTALQQGRSAFNLYVGNLELVMVPFFRVESMRAMMWSKVDNAEAYSVDYEEWTPFTHFVENNTLNTLMTQNIFSGGKVIYQVSLRGKN